MTHDIPTKSTALGWREGAARATVSSPNTPSVGAIVHRRLDELRPNPRNARSHSRRKIKDLAKAIGVVGFIGVIVIDASGMILAGHARYAAAKSVGYEDRPDDMRLGLERGAHARIRAR